MPYAIKTLQWKNKMLNDIDSSYAAQTMVNEFQQAVWDFVRTSTSPSVLYKPTLSLDGDMWCALMGEDLQVGLAGFGQTPELAMKDFDARFKTK